MYSTTFGSIGETFQTFLDKFSIQKRLDNTSLIRKFNGKNVRWRGKVSDIQTNYFMFTVELSSTAPLPLRVYGQPPSRTNHSERPIELLITIHVDGLFVSPFL